MFGAVYHIAPRVVGIEWCKPKLVRVHFWLATFGILLFVLPLAIGGVIQGIKLNNPEISVLDVTKSTMLFLRISTTGELLIILGNLLFLFNLAGMVMAWCKKNCCQFCFSSKAAVELKTAEVKP
jgi:cytochrome c oxidase cbb3-type subunit 1